MQQSFFISHLCHITAGQSEFGLRVVTWQGPVQTPVGTAGGTTACTGNQTYMTHIQTNRENKKTDFGCNFKFKVNAKGLQWGGIFQFCGSLFNQKSIKCIFSNSETPCLFGIAKQNVYKYSYSKYFVPFSCQVSYHNLSSSGSQCFEYNAYISDHLFK